MGMKILDKICLWLVGIAGVHVGLVQFVKFDLPMTLGIWFGQSWIEIVLKGAIMLAGLYTLWFASFGKK